MNTPHPLLTLEKINKTYPSPAEGGLQVLRDINLTVIAGETIAIIGPSGSGKSTLLNIIGTLDTPTSGHVRLEGIELNSLPIRGQARIRNEKIGMIFQMHHLLKQCHVLENVLIPALVNPHPAGAEQRARSLLDKVGLSHRLTHRPGQLSVGEQLRVAVARAMINRPHLLLADEPTGSLNHSGAEHLADLMLTLNQQEGTALIVVTHSLSLANRMDKVYELLDGQLVAK
ncbi:MAG: ABC transporter ATP-binding protein [bacterium]|jgi:lipoprotein-releasing system ATP-binding protein